MRKHTAPAKNYDGKYDILKFCLSFFVVAIHSQLLPLVLYPWLRIAVPLFFIMTSYFLFSKMDSVPQSGRNAVLRRFAARNGKLYLFWFLVLLPVTVYVRRELWLSGTVLDGVFLFLRSLFFGSTFQASWYITASVFGVTIIFLLSQRCRAGLIRGIALAVFCIVTLRSSYFPLLGPENVLRSIFERYEMVLGNPALSFPASLLWIAAGLDFARDQLPLRRFWESRMTLLLSCVGLYLEWLLVKKLTGSYNNDSYFMLLPVCISFFALLQKQPTVACGVSLHLKQASTVIYTTHASIISVTGFFYRSVLGVDMPILRFVTAAAGSIILYGIMSYLISHFPDSGAAKLLRNGY